MSAPVEPGSRRRGACLFTDLVGFTQYTDAVGDAAALGVLERQTDLAEQALEGCEEARIVKELGDGLFVWVCSAAEAIAAANTLMHSTAIARAAGSFPLSLRMGLHFGEVQARGDDLVGQTVNIASRIADLAAPRELLVSERAIEAGGTAREAYDLRPVGPVLVKGVREPIWLQRLQT